MGILDEIRLRGASMRLTDEMLYAEALREVQSGMRREGLWAKALAESEFDEGKAAAAYLRLRVQALKDEAAFAQSASRSEDGQRQLEESRRRATREQRDVPKDNPTRNWLVLVGLLVGSAVLGVLVMFALLK